MDINFLLSNDNDDKQLVYSEGNKMEITFDNEADENIKGLVQSLLTRY